MSAGSLIVLRASPMPHDLQDAAGFVVEVDGAGKRVGLGPPFEHDDSRPCCASRIAKVAPTGP